MAGKNAKYRNGQIINSNSLHIYVGNIYFLDISRDRSWEGTSGDLLLTSSLENISDSSDRFLQQ